MTPWPPLATPLELPHHNIVREPFTTRPVLETAFRILKDGRFRVGINFINKSVTVQFSAAVWTGVSVVTSMGIINSVVSFTSNT